MRGEDCVSLGWCFWHRACYGCLLCGSKHIASGVKLEELFGDLDDDLEDNMGKTRGREIEGPPLCAHCLVEAELDGMDERAVVQKGLRRMDCVDGGLGRTRWEASQGQPLPLRIGSHQTGAPVRDAIDAIDPPDSTIYVSINDPLGEPAFKPSPTKPIPRWMQMLPGNRRQYYPDASRQSTPVSPSRVSSTSTQQLGPLPERARTSSSISTVCPQKILNPASTPPSLSPRVSSLTRTSSGGSITDFHPRTVEDHMKRHTPSSWVSHEPLKRPSSRMAYIQGHQRTVTEVSTSSAYATPPEFSFEEHNEIATLPCRPQPGLAGTMPSRHVAFDELPAQLTRTRPPLSAPAVPSSHKHDTVRPTARTPPPLSSEYLEKYRPIRSPSPRPLTITIKPAVTTEAQRIESVAATASSTESSSAYGPTNTVLQPSRIQDTVLRSRIAIQRAAGDQMPNPDCKRQSAVDGAGSMHSMGPEQQPNIRDRRHLRDELRRLFWGSSREPDR
ncbi:mediator of rna polymerase ii transcription [Verticillium dahliae]